MEEPILRDQSSFQVIRKIGKYTFKPCNTCYILYLLVAIIHSETDKDIVFIFKDHAESIGILFGEYSYCVFLF